MKSLIAALLLLNLIVFSPLIFFALRRTQVSKMSLPLEAGRIDSIHLVESGGFNGKTLLILTGAFSTPPPKPPKGSPPVGWGELDRSTTMRIFRDLEPLVRDEPVKSFFEEERYYVCIDPGRPRTAMSFSGDEILMEIDNRQD